MEKSKKHHYIPQFYARNFTNEDKLIYVINKYHYKGVFERNPKSIFYEKNRNSFYDEFGNESDTIEKIYSELDNIFAPIVKEFLHTGQLTVEKLRMFIFLAYIMKWRVPQYDESFRDAENELTAESLGLRLKENGITLNIDLEKIFYNDEMRETKRLLFAIQAFRFKDDYKKIFANTFLLGTPIPSLINECPFVEYSLMSNNVFEDFIFPISSDYTLVYSSRIDKHEFSDFLNTNRYEEYIRRFSMNRDIALYHLSDGYVGCSNKGHLEEIHQKYLEITKNDRFRKLITLSVFHLIHNYKINY